MLTNIYAPCVYERNFIFLEWFRNIAPDDGHWLIVGDFNLLKALAT